VIGKVHINRFLKFTWNGLNNKGSVIECGDELLESAERFRDVYIHLHDQVDSIALEQRVLLLVKDDDNVARLKSRLLIIKKTIHYN
jgi:hypothetical protein